jgi:hypothetical protein
MNKHCLGLGDLQHDLTFAGRGLQNLEGSHGRRVRRPQRGGAPPTPDQT